MIKKKVATRIKLIGWLFITLLLAGSIWRDTCKADSGNDTEIYLYEVTSVLTNHSQSHVISSCNQLTNLSCFNRAGTSESRIKNKLIWLSNKQMNKKIKSTNGNRNSNSILKIIHWNGGARLWNNKIEEIEALLVEKQPDLCYISESNLWNDLDPDERFIPGYTIHYPNTMDSLFHARIILLSKKDLTVDLLPNLSDKESASIWCKVGRKKNSSLIVGGIYRQHQLLGRTRPDATRNELQLEQEIRWSKILKKLKNISRNKNCIVIGDLNLDHLRWNNPELHLENMVEMTKTVIENCGFQQLITNHTRTWTNQANSLLDQVWSNCPHRTVNLTNVTRASSDHNVVGITVSVKNIKMNGQNIVRRCYKNFDKNLVTNEFRMIDWSPLYRENNVDVANSHLEEKICQILDYHAPFKTIQCRAKYKNWISSDTK